MSGSRDSVTAAREFAFIFARLLACVRVCVCVLSGLRFVNQWTNELKLSGRTPVDYKNTLAGSHQVTFPPVDISAHVTL